MCKVMALLIGLVILPHNLQQPIQDGALPRAELIHRFEHGAGDDAVMEATIDLANRIKESGDKVAIRLCSKDPLPLAMFTNAISPTLMVAKNLGHVPHLTPDNILYLRAEDCMGPNPLIAAGELWVIPKGANLPSSVESLKYCQLQIKNVASESTIKNSRGYRTVLQKLSRNLRDNPKLAAIIIGNYFRTPRPDLRRNLLNAEKMFERDGTPPNQNFIRLQILDG